MYIQEMMQQEVKSVVGMITDFTVGVTSFIDAIIEDAKISNYEWTIDGVTTSTQKFQISFDSIKFYDVDKFQTAYMD